MILKQLGKQNSEAEHALVMKDRKEKKKEEEVAEKSGNVPMLMAMSNKLIRILMNRSKTICWGSPSVAHHRSSGSPHQCDQTDKQDCGEWSSHLHGGGRVRMNVTVPPPGT